MALPCLGAGPDFRMNEREESDSQRKSPFNWPETFSDRAIIFVCFFLHSMMMINMRRKPQSATPPPIFGHHIFPRLRTTAQEKSLNNVYLHSYSILCHVAGRRPEKFCYNIVPPPTRKSDPLSVIMYCFATLRRRAAKRARC